MVHAPSPCSAGRRQKLLFQVIFAAFVGFGCFVCPSSGALLLSDITCQNHLHSVWGLEFDFVGQHSGCFSPSSKGVPLSIPLFRGLRALRDLLVQNKTRLDVARLQRLTSGFGAFTVAGIPGQTEPVALPAQVRLSISIPYVASLYILYRWHGSNLHSVHSNCNWFFALLGEVPMCIVVKASARSNQ